MRTEIDPRGRGTGWFGRLAFPFSVAYAVALAVLIVSHLSPPSLTDYANWTYQGVLLARHLRGLPDAAHWLKPYPVPNSASTLAIGVLALLMSWQMAAKVWLCLQIVISYTCLRYLVRTLGVGDGGAVWFVAPQAIFFNINFWYGFVNFQLGLCWVLLMAGMLLHRLDASTRHLPAWPLGVLLGVAFFTHMIPFAFCGLLLLLFAVQTRRWKLLWQWLPSGLLTVCYLAARYLLAHDADGQAGMVSSVKNYSAAFWAFKGNSYLKSFGFINPWDSAPAFLGDWGYLALFAVNGVLALVVAVALFHGFRSDWKSRAQERFLWVGVALLIPPYLLAPGAIAGISDPGARLLQVGLSLGLVLSLRHSGWTSRVAAGCGAVLSLAALILFVRFAETPNSPDRLHGRLPAFIAEFAHVPNTDQDGYYRSLERGEFGAAIFPTGMFLNSNPAPPPKKP